MLDGAAEFKRQLAAIAHELVHADVEQRNRLSDLALAAIHGKIGIGEQLLAVGAMVREKRYADADAGLDDARFPTQREWKAPG